MFGIYKIDYYINISRDIKQNVFFELRTIFTKVVVCHRYIPFTKVSQINKRNYYLKATQKEKIEIYYFSIQTSTLVDVK